MAATFFALTFFALIGLVSWISPSAALAATISTTPSGSGTVALKYVAAAGEVNDVTVSGALASGTFTVKDSGPGVAGTGVVITADPASNCTVSLDFHKATCSSVPGATINIETVDLGNRDDRLKVDSNIPSSSSFPLLGGDGNDVITGGSASDYIVGGDGNDIIDGGPGADFIDGGGGNDTVTYASRIEPVKVHLENGPSYCNGNGDDKASPDGSPLTCQPGPNFNANGDTITPITENIIGGAGDDQLTGNQSDNIIVGGRGADVISGGLGVDTVDYCESSNPVTDSNCTRKEPVTVTISDPCTGPGGTGNDGGAADGPLGARDCVLGDVENITGGDGNDVLVGSDPVNPALPSSDPNRISGANVLDGRGGDDLLIGKCGADVFIGGPGNDTVSYADRTEPITATIDGVGDDGGACDLDPASGRRDNIGNDVENIIGGKGDDVIEGSASDNVLDGGGGNDHIDGGGGNDTIQGGPGNDTLIAGAGHASLDGGPGSDVLDGGAGGHQILNGGPGDDILTPGRGGGNTLIGGGGNDTVDYSARLNPVTVSADGLPHSGEAGEGDTVMPDVENLTGGSDSDRLVAGPNGGTLNGGPGDDTLVSGPGPDVLIGGSGRDTADYSSRTRPVTVSLDGLPRSGEAGEGDTVMPDVENVTGGDGSDRLVGNAAANTLHGGPGDDTLIGGGGFDTLHGDAGNDTLIAGRGPAVLDAGPGNDILKGGPGGHQILNGGPGDDSLTPGRGGGNTLIGGGGNDTVDYSSRTKAVHVELQGGNDNGERGENDFIATDIHNVRTGAGNDTIDSSDGAKGHISCDGGIDSVIADPFDVVAPDCERVKRSGVSATARCTVVGSRVKMTRKGVVRVRVSCPVAARGTVKLRSARAIRSAVAREAGRKARKILLGRRSFRARAGRTTAVRVKLTRKGRRAVLLHKRLRSKVTVVTRAPKSAAVKSVSAKSSRLITIKAPRSKRGSR